jgi:hypothetical protein
MRDFLLYLPLLWVCGSSVLMIASTTFSETSPKAVWEYSCHNVEVNHLEPGVVVAFWEHSNCTGEYFVVGGELSIPGKSSVFDPEIYNRISSLKVFNPDYMVTVYGETLYRGTAKEFHYSDSIDTLVPYDLNDKMRSFIVSRVGKN